MTQAYTPALEASPRKVIRKIRELPLPGRALVKPGDSVRSDTPVLAAELPGAIDIVRIADRLGLDPEDVLSGMKVKVGDSVKAKDVLCEVKSFFGWFTSTVVSPADGVVEFFTEANAHMGIRHPPNPLSVEAYIEGTVVEVEETKTVTIETVGAIIQGIFGVGGERFGEVAVLEIPADAVVDEAMIANVSQPKGKILIGGRSFTIGALHACAAGGVSAVVSGSIDAVTLRDFVGHEIGVSITGDEKVPFSLIVTEGFGSLPISNRILELARGFNGKRASLNGATQVRAGALRPELIVPGSMDGGPLAAETPQHLEVGARVRVIRVPFFGQFGEVTELPHSLERLESGAVVRVAKVRLHDGRDVVVPRANIELLA